MPSRRILVVDDSPGSAQITASLFQMLGHTTCVALDGASAVREFEAFSPEIVLLDVELPDVSGMEVTRRMRCLDTHADTLIVALTGHSEDEYRREALDSGCDVFLVKPVDVRVLKQLAQHPKLNKPR